SGTQFRVKCNVLNHPNGSYVVHLIEVNEKNDDNNHKALALSMNQINSGKFISFYIFFKDLNLLFELKK
ncbi:unnamed protein product, partial [Adineta steineri]